MSESSKPTKPFLAMMLLSAAGLVIAGCWLSEHFVFDKQSAQSASMIRQVNTRGESISLFNGLNVYDGRTDELIWHAETPGKFPYLVDHHYIVGLREGLIEAIDIDDALTVPIDRLKNRDVAFRPFNYKLVELTPNAAESASTLLVIPDSNRFLVQLPITSGSVHRTIHAFEIQSRTIRLLKSWTFGSAAAVVLPDGDIYTTSIDDASIEVRSSLDFDIKRTLALLPGVPNWGIARTRNHLFCYTDLSTRATRVGRLDDLSMIPELDIELCNFAKQETGADRRYHVFSDGPLWQLRRLAVYDSIERRIVFESGPVNACSSVEVRDGKLLLSTRAFGTTTYQFDFQTGQTKVVRPYFWIVVAFPCVLLAALTWLIIWIWRVPSSGVRLPLNILFVSLLFLTPLYHFIQRTGYSFFPPRHSVDFGSMVVFALCYCLAMLAAFGKSRLLLRCLPLVLTLEGLFALMYVSKLVELEYSNPRSPAALALRTWVTFSILSAFMLGTAKFLGLAITRNSSAKEVATIDRGGQIRLLDIFVVTAIFALGVTILGAQVDLIFAQEVRPVVLGRSCLLVAAASLGLFALVPSERIYRTSALIAIALALFCSGEMFLLFAYPHDDRMPWHRLAYLLLGPTFLSHTVFAYCSMMRQAGYRWSILKGRAALPKPT